MGRSSQLCLGFHNQIIHLQLTSDLEHIAEVLGESLHGLTKGPLNGRYETPLGMLQLFREGAATDLRDCVYTFVGFIPALQASEFIVYSQSLQGIKTSWEEDDRTETQGQRGARSCLEGHCT
jgi:hypothetical protein